MKKCVFVRWLDKMREGFKLKRLSDLPHINQVLCERDGLGVSGHGDGSIHASARATVGQRIALFAVGNSDHRAAQLPDFGYFRSALSDDAADQLVGNRHFVRLLRRLRPVVTSGCGQSGQG